MTSSARIPEEDACHCARNMFVFSRVKKGTPRLTHKGCVLQRVFLDAISDVTVVLAMRQSRVEIAGTTLFSYHGVDFQTKLSVTAIHTIEKQ